ncbi:hypothetical protein CRYUN_Cryun19dG0135000 [Craigia yunnanensis]
MAAAHSLYQIQHRPPKKPDRVVSTEKVPRWSRKAIKSFAMAELDARKLKYPITGTEAFLMGILIEGLHSVHVQSELVWLQNFCVQMESHFLRCVKRTVKLPGRGDMCFFSPEHPPLTEGAQRVLDWAVDLKLKSGDDGEITATQLRLGIWSEVESPGHKTMAALGFNDAKAKELTSLRSEPESVDG